MSEEATYKPVEPFDIDDGQLDGMAPERAFTLGVEWQMVRDAISRGDDVERPVHTDNHRRLAALLSRNGYYQRWEHGDDWSQLFGSPHVEG